jgi:hypothetical protein
MHSMTLRSLSAAGAALLSCVPAWAHGGHGAAEWHWHASDTFGFVLVAALAAAAIWFSRGGK